MAFNSTINTGISPNDGQGAGLRTNLRKLIENDNFLKQNHSTLETSHNTLQSTVNNSFSSFKIKTYTPVSLSQRPELLGPDGNSLKISSTYRIRLNTTSTETKSGAVYLLNYFGGNWISHLVSRNGSGSNYPSISIEASVVRLKTSHSSNYPVITVIEEFPVNPNNALSFWGADFFATKKDSNLGIGTENPSEKLEVSGNIKCTSLIQTSDKKFKKNIEKIDGSWALNVFKKLNFSFYDFSLTNSKQAGLIAQEVEKILPQAVHTSENGEKGLNHTYIDMVCKAAIQHFIKTQIQ